MIRNLMAIGALAAGSLAAVPAVAAASASAPASAVAAASAPASALVTHDGLPAVYPTPRQITPRPGTMRIPAAVTVVRGSDASTATVRALGSVLRAGGARAVTDVAAGTRIPAGGLTVYLGSAPDSALHSLAAPAAAGLPAGGYVLAAGDQHIVLEGKDQAGTFYAVQTLRQLIRNRSLHDVVVRDYPAMPVRGTIEGFYGPSWSDSDIASQLAFYGANKMNTFVYSAKNDPYLRANWQQLYPPAQLSALATLVSDASANQVNFVYALSPGLSICYSDPTDLQELEAKDQQLWNAGVRQFALFFDDIGSGFNCAADQAQFGSSPDPLAAAQAYLLNAFVSGFIDTHPGADELITVPTDYAGVADSAYRDVWKASLTQNVLVYWTGVGVIPQTITSAQASQVASEFGHQIVVWDNYPVNDYQPTRLFLGPLTGRAPDLASAVAGFTSNPMQEAAPSQIPLFTTAAYTWNPVAYDAAQTQTWEAGISAYGGPAAFALSVLAQDNQSTPRIGTLPEAPHLAADIATFWSAYQADTGPAISPALRSAAVALAADWAQIAVAGTVLQHALDHPDFVSEAGPWLAKFRAYGSAGAMAVKYLLDSKAGVSVAGDAAVLSRLYAQVTAIPQVVGEGVFENFLLTADPSLLSYNVSLYAADPVDAQAASAAAAAAGLPASDVTTSFTTAWNQTSSGEYLVIAVGGPADNALYYNVCGWTAPDGIGAGSTPFYYASSALNTLPPMNEYENAAGQTASDTASLSADLAYYAVHGSYPSGSTPPPAAPPAYTCSGQPGS
jgi:hyaluronoglucosaminidase